MKRFIASQAKTGKTAYFVAGKSVSGEEFDRQWCAAGLSMRDGKNEISKAGSERTVWEARA